MRPGNSKRLPSYFQLKHSLRPDGQHVSCSIGEVETSSAGELELGHNYAAALQPDRDFRGRKVRGIKHHERRKLPRPVSRLTLVETAVDSSALEAGVLRPIIHKAPAEDGRIKLLGLLNVGGWKLNVIDLVVICCIAHRFSPFCSNARGGEEKAGADRRRRHTLP